MNNYQSDCIHLRACRRVQKIGRGHGHQFPRNCTAECTSYMAASNISESVESVFDNAIRSATPLKDEGGYTVYVDDWMRSVRDVVMGIINEKLGTEEK